MKNKHELADQLRNGWSVVVDPDTGLPIRVGTHYVQLTGDDKWEVCLDQRMCSEWDDHRVAQYRDLISACRRMVEEADGMLNKPVLPQIYFIGNSVRLGANVKIGTSYDPQARLKTLQTASQDELHILAWRFGGPAVEKDYHRRFRQSRRRGEWFTITKAIAAEIERLQAAD